MRIHRKILLLSTLTALAMGLSACGKDSADPRMDPGESQIAADIVISPKTLSERTDILVALIDRELTTATGGRVKRLKFFKAISSAVVETMLEVEGERAKVFEYQAAVRSGAKIPTALQDSIDAMKVRYKAKSTDDLQDRADFVPIDLMFTQAAVESSSGTSSVARDCNNLFGVHASSRAQACPGHPILAYYPSFTGSIKRYVHLLNTGSAYKAFRVSRRNIRASVGELGVLDSSILVQGLLSYSERGQEYVNQIARQIVADRLDKLYEEFIQRIN